MELNAIDRKIMYLLGKNSRLSYTALAKVLRLKREVIAFRIKRLIKNEIIQGTTTIVNPNTVGLLTVNIFVRVHSLVSERKHALEVFLKKESCVSYVQRLVGTWDYSISTVHPRQYDLSLFVDKLTTEFPEIVNLITLFVLHEEGPGWSMILDKTPKPPLLADKTAFSQHFTEKHHHNYISLDVIDKKLLRTIATNTRIGIVDLAKNVGISYRTAHKKISYLLKSGVITGFALHASLSKLSFTQRIVLINVKNIQKNDAKMKEFLKSTPWCSRFWRMFGGAHYRISVYTKNQQEFADFIQSIRETFGTDIISIESMEILKVLKRVGITHYLDS